MPGVVSGTFATSFQHILWQLHEVDLPLPIYTWEIALFGSLGMAPFPQESCFLGENFPGKGTAWEEALKPHSPLENLQVSTWWAYGKRRTQGERRPGLSSLCSAQMQRAVVTFLVLTLSS